MKTNLFKIFSIAMMIILSGCPNVGNNPPSGDKEIKPPIDSINKNLNISILLDLSDRINPDKYPNPSMEFYQRDAQYIKSVSHAFVQHLKSKKVILLNDKIGLYFSPEPSVPEINTISKELKVNFDRNSSKNSLTETEEKYKNLPIKIYESAIKDGKYVGSDIWRFFKDNVKNYCIEKDKRNILVILTDGYLYHKNSEITDGNTTSFLTPQLVRQLKLNSTDWKNKIEKEGFGFIPATNDLNDLEILVLGINPDEKNPFEGDVIELYWSNWLKEMNVSNYKILKADLPSNLEKPITEFILN